MAADSHTDRAARTVSFLLAGLLLIPPPTAAEDRWQLVLEWGEGGTGPGQLISPWAVAVDDSENVYVVDRFNNRVLVYDDDGAFLHEWGEGGSGQGQFSNPTGIAADEEVVYVVEGIPYHRQCRVQRFTSLGVYLGTWGSCDGPGNLQAASGIDVADGLAYLAGDNEVLKYALPGRFVGEFPDFDVRDVGIAPDGSVWAVSQWLARVRRYSPDGEVLAEWSAQLPYEPYSSPKGLSVDSSGNIYVTDGYAEVKCFSPDGEVLAHFGLPWHDFLGIEAFGDDTLYMVSNAPPGVVKYRRVPLTVEATTWGAIKAAFSR